MPVRENRVVIVLGAGATLADGVGRPAKRQPPLDRGLFSNVLPAYGAQLRPVAKYMQEHHGAHLRAADTDGVLAPHTVPGQHIVWLTQNPRVSTMITCW